ncbi:MAG TPA: peptide ABC transporter substrate-binding protein [Anaerolineae bacterium]|nr:peptide ABC transporter substrate-binding protein [Anaerolineae bacterium]
MIRWTSLLALLSVVSLLVIACAAPGSFQGVPQTVIVPQTVVVRETAAPQTTAAPAAGNQTLIWSVEGVNELPGLDPANPQNAQSVLAINLIFGGLVKLDGQLNVVPDGAEKWSVSDDGKTYTFTIRQGLKFGDGTPVTAQNFADSINRALQPATASYGAAFQLQHVVGAKDVADGKVQTASGIKVVDDHTLQITTDDTVPYFLAQLTYPVTFVVPLDYIKGQGDKWTDKAFGIGPYRVKEWVHNQKLVLEPNPYYWGGTPGVSEIQLPFIQDSETAYQLYRTGGLDIMGSQQNPVPSARVPEVNSSPDFHQVAAFATRYIGFNNKKAPFDNLNVRRAFAMAVDKVTLAERVLNGAAGPTDRILPPGFPGSQYPIKGLAFDPAAAKEELAKAGYGASKPFPQVTLTYGVEGDNERVVTFLQQQWKDNLGVDVTLQPLELGTFSKNLDTTFLTPDQGLQFYLSIWGADYPDPQNFVTLQLLSNSPNNNGHWESADFDAIGKKADTFTGPAEERFKLYNQAEQLAIDGVGWLPLFVPRFSVLIKPYVSGVVPTGQYLIIPDFTALRGRPSQQ